MNDSTHAVPDRSALRHLMGAYFHQDFVMDGGTSADTVRSFTRERTELVRDCVDDIEALLSQPMPEREFEATLDGWGCDYRAGDSDQDYRNWLSDVRMQLVDYLSEAGEGARPS